MAEHVAKPLDESAVKTGGRADEKDWVYLRTRPTGPVDRTVREAEAFAQAHHEQALLDPAAVKKAIDETVFHELPENLEGLSIRELNERRIRQIPKVYADAWEREFRPMAHNAFTDVFDKPIHVWRTLTLLGRPAFATYNVVTQHVLYGLHYAGARGLVNYLKAVKAVLGDRAVQKLAEWTKRQSAGSIHKRVALDAVDEVLPGLRMGGFSHTHLGSPDGLFENTRRGLLKEHGTLTLPGGKRTAELGTVGKAAYQVGRVPLKPFEVFGRTIGKMNTVGADDLTRVASGLTELEKHHAVQQVQKAARNLEGVNLSAMEAAKRIGKASPEEGMRLAQDILRKVDATNGDYRHLTPFERNYVRRFVAPFWSWYRNIVLITGRLVRDYPERLVILNALGNQARASSILLGLPMPSWLQGYLPIGGIHNGNLELLDTQSLNPLSTPVQLADMARAMLPPRFGGSTASADANPIGLLGPYAAAFAAATGHDPETGDTYYGPGQNQGPAGRFAGEFFQSFPQVNTTQQVFGGKRIPGTNTRVPAPYPSSLYTQKQLDAILAYLGIPRKHVNLERARELAQEGR